MSGQNQFALLGQRRFAPFFATQALGAFNDNAFRNALVVLVGFHMGLDESAVGFYSNIAPALFILPFFLFSATSGQLAEKFEKTRIIRFVKLFEIAAMALASIAFYRHSLWLMLTVLFLMGLHSTLFGPIKYAILPQALREQELVGGNGLVEMGTSMSILLGMLLGGTLIAASGEHGTLYASIAVLLIARWLGGGSSRDIFAAWVLGGFVTWSLGLVALGRALPGYRYRPALAGTLATELSRVGLPNYFLTLTERAPGFVLPIVVTELLSPADNAHWYAAWMMAWVVFVIPIQVGMTSFAEIAREPDAAGRIVRQGIRTSLAVGIAGALAVAVLAGPLLSLLGSGYAAAGAFPLRLLAIGIIPLTFIQAYFSYCRARRRLGEAIALGTLNCLASIVAPAVAGMSGGLVAMAVAWLAVQAVSATVAAARLRRLAQMG
jgi:O-antigen/teichoic acid export membrane protein